MRFSCVPKFGSGNAQGTQNGIGTATHLETGRKHEWPLQFRTSTFHGENRGSIPHGRANKIKIIYALNAATITTYTEIYGKMLNAECWRLCASGPSARSDGPTVPR
jgi:hypothetical protein